MRYLVYINEFHKYCFHSMQGRIHSTPPLGRVEWQIYLWNSLIYTMLRIKSIVYSCLITCTYSKNPISQMLHFHTRGRLIEFYHIYIDYVIFKKLIFRDNIKIMCNITILFKYIHIRIHIKYKDNVLCKEYTGGHFASTCCW